MRTFLVTAILAISVAASAQSNTDLVELVRSDLRTEKQAIVLANMQMSEDQSKAFAPIYDEYMVAMKAHWDKRIQLVKDYAAAYTNMNDETATSLLKRMNTLEKEALTIRGTYEKKMMKVLPATLVARWVQVERRLGQLIDLQLADEIPLMR